MSTPDQIAVLIPCLNEAETIGKVIGDFRVAAPDARIVVIDNGSTDDTAAIARGMGADVIHEARRGKGRALRTAFERVDASIYVLADGDDQAPADRLPALIEPIRAGVADLVVGSRALGSDLESHLLNRLGNRAFSWLLRTLLSVCLTDVLSGYRAISRPGLDRIRLHASNFEFEVELTMKAVQAHLRVVEIPIEVRSRPVISEPRMRAMRDGMTILAAIAVLLLGGRPARVLMPLGFGLLAAAAVPTAAARSAVGSASVLGWRLARVIALAGFAALAAAVALEPSARRLQAHAEADARVVPQA